MKKKQKMFPYLLKRKIGGINEKLFREIQFFQQSVHLLMSKLSFFCVVKEIFQHKKKPYRFFEYLNMQIWIYSRTFYINPYYFI